LKKPTNLQIAELLEQIADGLEADDANPFRVRAYREGATIIRHTKLDVAELIHENQMDELKALPAIGDGIAAVIQEYVNTGASNLLKNLEAQASPEVALAEVPGIGKGLAERIVEKIHVKTLPELELAAHDGRLETVEGFGPRRVEGVRASLAGMLSRSARSQRRQTSAQTPDTDDERPSVKLLLAVDEDYRQRAKKNDLQKIAPRRFNPNNEAWLPVLHTEREGWSFTAMFSNTAQAHELEKTNDWVVIYYERDNKEQQHTVVTETHGVLEGKRVVRGRNAENRQHYHVQTD
jgi:DNA polymerase (family X)